MSDVAWFHLYETSGIDTSMETKSKLVFARSWEKDEWQVTFYWEGVLFLGDTSVLELDRGGTGIQHYEYTKYHLIVNFKMLNFMT